MIEALTRKDSDTHDPLCCVRFDWAHDRMVLTIEKRETTVRIEKWAEPS